jgi:uncharacterized protein YceH (UPF0502 family)
MARALTPLEARVLGVLVEKQATVPDTCPLSLNALVAGCNQKTARDPVINASDAEVLAAIDGLKSMSLVFETSGGRVSKYEHNAARGLNVPGAAAALLAVLMLRGPQTAAELRANAERLHRFADISAVEGFLNELAERYPPRAVLLPRAPGARGSLTTSGPPLSSGRAASSSRKASTEEVSANRCSRSQFVRSSEAVCGPRSISTASSATDCEGSPSTRPALCS